MSHPERPSVRLSRAGWVASSLAFILLILAGCGLRPTPNEFPPPPMTVIVEWPQITPTTTLEPRLRPILPDDLQAAETFFWLLKTFLAAGNGEAIGGSVHYPLTVTINGDELQLRDPQEFMDQYSQIFDRAFVGLISAMEEPALSLEPNGIRLGQGELWFNYYCADPACAESEFLITQINK